MKGFLAVTLGAFLLLAGCKFWHAKQTWYKCKCPFCTCDPYTARFYSDMEANYANQEGK